MTGAPGRIRTHDRQLTKLLLCRLSYRGVAGVTYGVEPFYEGHSFVCCRYTSATLVAGNGVAPFLGGS